MTIQWRHKIASKLIEREPVIDFGGGEGIVLSMLKEQKGFSRLTLVDNNPDAVKNAERNGFHAISADITKSLSFADNSFQTACAVDVLEHVHDPLAVLLEMKRIAREIVVVVPNFQYWKARLEMLLGRIPFQSKAKRQHVFWFNYSIFNELMKDSGLKVDKIIYGGLLRFGFLGSFLARLRPSLFSFEFAVRLIKK